MNLNEAKGDSKMNHNEEKKFCDYKSLIVVQKHMENV